MRQERVEVFKAKNGQWGWKCVSSNGRIIFTAGETFVSKSNAIRAIKNALSAVYSITAAQPVLIMERNRYSKNVAVESWPMPIKELRSEWKATMQPVVLRAR